MRFRVYRLICLCVAALCLTVMLSRTPFSVAAISFGGPASAGDKGDPATTWQIFATGLENPRGLQFGPDGFLYVAEGGQGGTTLTTPADCAQVPSPSGPYRGGKTARISKIAPDGKRTTVIAGLPSTQTAPQSGSEVSGAAAVAFLDNTLYAVLTGAGCSHGNRGTVNALLKINEDGTATQVADISAFLHNNPTRNQDPVDFEPDGDIYGLIAVNGKFYVVEANHGELDEITADGVIRRVVDISDSQGHSVPTSVAFNKNTFYVSSLSVFPVHVGIARIFKITPDGQLTVLAPELTAVLGLAFDSQGQLYALETTTVDNAYPMPGTGRVVRVQADSTTPEVIASGLNLPTAMTFGPDGMLYISNFGFGFKPGTGQIVRLAVPSAHNEGMTSTPTPGVGIS